MIRQCLIFLAFLLLFPCRVRSAHQYFPEEISGIDYLTNNLDSNKEYFVAVFSSNPNHNDVRNGVAINQMPVTALFNTCPGGVPITSSASFTPSGEGNAEWTQSSVKGYYPSKTQCLSNFFASTTAANHLISLKMIELDKILDSNLMVSPKLLSSPNYIVNYYYWIENNDGTSKTQLYYACDPPKSCSTASQLFDFKQTYNQNSINQIVIQKRGTNYSGALGVVGVSCPSHSLVVKFPANTQINVHMLKITISEVANAAPYICSNHLDCPPSTYCNVSSTKCVECDKRYATCRSPSYTCGRFTHQWGKSAPIPCEAEYFNINHLGPIRFEISPIKSGAATLAFWIYLPKIHPTLTSTAVLHFSLEDNFVVSMIYDSNTKEYVFYLIPYQNYHKAIGAFIEETTTNQEFTALLSNSYVATWYSEARINEIAHNRWIYAKFGVNYLSSETFILLSHNKRANSSTEAKKVQATKTIPRQYLYSGSTLKKTNFQFMKYYRNGDMISLSIKNGKSFIKETELILHHLYVFGSYLPYDNTVGFEYYDLLSIVTQQSFFPELIFGCDFNRINKVVNGFTLSYHSPPQTSKTVNIGETSNEALLYSYPLRLYRLTLLDNSNANKQYATNDIISTSSLSCSNPYLYCFSDNKAFSCFTNNYVTNIYSCRPNCPSAGYIISKGLNRNQNGMCMKSCTNCSTSTCTGTNCQDGPSNISCNTNYNKINGNCYYTDNSYRSSSNRGALYYSYFFNFPPLYVPFTQITSYYFEFLFLPETNTFLYPPPEFKGKKVYFMYTNAFSLWSDYQMKTFYLDDKSGNPSSDFSHLINMNNWNRITISVRSGNGKLFINNNYSSSFLFDGSPISFLTFCHNDVNCVNRSIYWSGGYYKQLRIWNADRFPYLNDLSLRSNYIYDEESLVNLMTLNTKLTPWLPTHMDVAILEGLNSIGLNIFTNRAGSNFNVLTSTPSNALYNTEAFSLYNFNDVQDLYLIPNKLNNYIDTTTPTYSDATCPSSCLSCYGPGNSFNSNCKTCSSNQHFSNSDCINTPSLRKTYFVFITNYPNDSSSSNSITFSVNYNKVTITFWLKVMGIKNPGTNYLVLFGHFMFSLTSSLVLQLTDTHSSNIVLASQDISSSFGKYVHISFAYYRYTDANSNYKFYLSLQVNNKLISTDPSLVDSASVALGCTIYNGVYAAFANMNAYSAFLVGGYGFDTNKYYQSQTPSITITQLINPQLQKCIVGNSLLDCVNDYNEMFNDELFPSNKGLLLLNDASIGSCDASCDMTCFGEESSKCSCLSNSFYSWIHKHQCRKLDYIDFQRYLSITFSNVPCPNSNNNGVEFWMFAAPTDINFAYTISMPNVVKIRMTYNGVNVLIDFEDGSSNYSRLNASPGRWIKVTSWYQFPWLYYSIEAQTPSSTNYGYDRYCSGTQTLSFSSSTHYSHGALFFRQFRVWYGAPVSSVSKTEIKTKFYYPNSNSNILIVIDPLISEVQSMNVYSSNRIIISSSLKNENFSYYNYAGSYDILNLCLETEECIPILNINQFQDIEIKDIKPSATGRYTIDLWIKTTDAFQLQRGINIIWEKHISLSVITDITKNNIDYYCFPQDYLNTPKGKSGTQIVKEAKTALNVDSFSRDVLTDSNKWIYVRCAYSWDMEQFYIQDEQSPVIIRKVNKEKAFPGFNMDYPVKYFLIDFDTTSLLIQNANKSLKTQTTIRTINLYTEYIPSEVSLSRVLYNSVNTLLESLSFTIDFKSCTTVGGNTEQCNMFNNKVSKTIRFNHSSSTPKVNGAITLCDINTHTYDALKLSCEVFSGTPNAKLYNGQTILECKNNWYLDTKRNPIECVSSPCSLNWTRSPGSTEISNICNYQCDLNHVPCTFTTNFSRDLKCNSGFKRVGYKCLPAPTQMEASFYFNRCYNFYPIYLAFTPNTQLLTKNGYAIEFWFKFDKVNEFCPRDNTKDRYVFWSYPHALYQKKQGDDVYYINLKTSISSPNPLRRISQYEWNYIIISYQTNFVSVYVNNRVDQADYSFSPPITIDYNLKAIAFCTNTANLCSPLGTQLNLEWSSAFYKKLRVYDLRYTNVYAINDYSLGKYTAAHIGLIISYSFNPVNNDLNIIHNEVNQATEFIDYNANIPLSSIYYHNDKVLMYTSTSSFDWGELNPGLFVSDVEPRTGVIKKSSPCHINCLRCYSDAIDDCYSCKAGFVLFKGECRSYSGTYFTIPEMLGSNIIINHPLVDFSKTNPITISFWMKFYGIKATNTESCVLIAKVSNMNGITMCFNMNTSKVIVNSIGGIILFEDTTLFTKAGAWQLISFSNYNSINTAFYPEMFSVAINGNVLPRANSYQIQSPGVILDTIEFGYNFIGIITDVKVYDTFIYNPFGIITNPTLKSDHLIFHLPLMGRTSIDCLSAAAFTPDITLLPNKCQQDYNLHHDSSITACPKNSYLSPLGCKQCNSRCHYCEGNSEINCACYHNSDYLFRKHRANNHVYCHLLPYHDFAVYDKVEFNQLKHGDTNEYAIDFWFFLYSYDEVNIKFTYQTVAWDYHVKVDIRFLTSSKKLHISCYPVHYETDPSLGSSYFLLDDSKTFNKWVHVTCATSLVKSKYYLNEIGVNALQGTYPKLTDRTDKSSLIFRSDPKNPLSDSIILIKELRLWSLFNLREFPFDCQYDPLKSSDVPYLLHHFPMTHDLTGDLADSLGNKAGVALKHDSIFGYNLVDYNNIYLLESELEQCVVLLTIPSRGYFNMTNYLLINQDTLPGMISYDYYYSISSFGDKFYSQMTLEPINLGTTDKEILQHYSDEKYKDIELNFYLQAKDALSKVFFGFTKVDIASYSKIMDIDYSIHAKLLSLLDPGLSFDQMRNRIKVLSSLTLIHDISYANILNQTESNLVDGRIQLINPQCSEEYCSYQGTCSIIVRTLACKCNEGYTGTNCHISMKNSAFLSPLYTSYWNLLSKNRNYPSVAFNAPTLSLFLSLVKGSSTLNAKDSHIDILQQYYPLLDYLKLTDPPLLINSIQELLMTENSILTNAYVESNQLRIDSLSKTNSTLIEVNDKDRLERVMDNITKSIHDIIGLEILNTGVNFEYSFSAFDVVGTETTKTFDYNLAFADRKEKYMPYIDSSLCSSVIFNTGVHAYLFLVMINYKYNPRSFHDLYANTSSHLLDIYYSNPTGFTISQFQCNEPIKIYFPVNIFDEKRINYIEAFSSLLNLPNPEDPNDPYLYNPIFVDKTGKVLRKTREERLIEKTRSFDLNCSYYQESADSFVRTSNMSITSDYFIECSTNHLSQFTVLFNDLPTLYPLSGLFFYVYYPQVFSCGENYLNPCFLLLCCLLLAFLIGLSITLVLDSLSKDTTMDMLENVKYQTLKEFRFFSSDKELKEEVKRINSIQNEAEIEREIEERRKTASGTVVTVTHNDQDPIIKETGAGKKIDQKGRMYRVQEYTPNNELGKEQNEYFDEMDDSNRTEKEPKDEEVEEEEKEGLSEDEGQHSNNAPPSKEKLILIDEESNTNQKTNQDITSAKNRKNTFFTHIHNDSDNDKLRTTIIPRGNKVFFVNELDQTKAINDFYEDIAQRNPSMKQLYLNLLFKRHFYLSPFTTSSLFNPRWKRIILLHTFTCFLAAFIVLFLTLVERTGLNEIGKMFIFALAGLIAANITQYLMILLYRRHPKAKTRMFYMLKTSAQLKLILEWKNSMTGPCFKYITGFVISFIVFIFSFAFTFNYCVVLYPSITTFIAAICIALGLDILLFEPLILLILALMYRRSQKNKTKGKSYRFLFSWINFKCCL